ncbi:MAG TPA: universal stress protein [Geminicoccaceae bacterium]|nr:universal stress protein [Geminicoccaceae bacterium]
MLKTILVAADGSDHGDKAVDWGIELAVKHDARLLLLYVAPHRVAPPELRRLAEVEHIVEPGGIEARPVGDPLYPSGAIARPDLDEAAVSSAAVYQQFGERLLDAARFRAEERQVKAIETLVEHGDPAHRIVDAAQHHGADLIVMGRRGHGDLKGLLLGSVSHKVSQLAACACLTVK